MELVYLWVEGYKNIHKQGFNFSPKFNCNYDPENKELTIKDNPNYIENFFGDNINVTAIVGKNGSGKSSIGEIVSRFSYEEFIDKQIFLIFFEKNSFSCKQSYTGEGCSFEIINNTDIKSPISNKSRIINTLYFANSISSIFNSPKLVNMEKYPGNINAYNDENRNLMPNNRLNFKDINKIHEVETFNKRFVHILKKYRKLLTKINKNVAFDKYKNELHFYELGTFFASDENSLKKLGINLQNKTIFPETKNHNSHLYKLIILFRLIKLQDKEKIQTIIENIKDIFKKDILSETDMIEIHNKISEFDNNLSDIFTSQNIQNIINSFEYLDNEIWIEKDGHNITDTNKVNDLLKLLYRNINRVNFYNSKKGGLDFYSLSSGEREYIKLFVTYIYHLALVIENTNLANEKRIFIFDEPDLGLHPNWQKQIFQDLIYIANIIIKENIHIVITSHSPFLLSDIPKQNIIFLDKDENTGNCIVVKDGLKEKKQTFGANIHTLLSDSFFMEDGLMGEFAKGKIDKAITLLNQEHLSDEELKYCEQIISIIGEPIVKNQLQRMLDSKRLKKIDEIDVIKSSMEAMQKRLDELEK